ncbi:MAG TPA: protein kinase [Gemmatimonadales bacterium]|nr:protein kinase [Gemmatimonadales bacterium]
MFCSRCGHEVEKATQFCPSCGLDLRVTTPIQAIATGDVTELDIVREALQGEYDILEELGRGGMAIVYRAMDKHLGREVAVKVLPFSLAFDADFVERFQREARTAAQLEHPNIIPIYRVGKSGRVIYFVMKYLRGASLSKIMAERPKLTPIEIQKILVDVGSALGYAAARGTVHRDVKPDNIMFDEHGLCVVTDFGIAKAGSGQRLTGTGMSIGTPHYMSPEQARAQPIDGRSDIYSLGIVAYQCLVGEVPYDGEDSFSIGYKHIMEPIPSPPLNTPDEKRLFEIIRKMIMKDPQDRFQDAEELMRALEGQPFSTLRRPTISQVGMAAQPTSPLPASQEFQAVAGRPGATTPSRPSGGIRVRTPTGARRPVAQRSIAQAPSRNFPLGWILLVLALGGGAAGFFIYRNNHPAGATAQPAPADTTTSPATGVPATLADSIRRAMDSVLAAHDSAQGKRPADTTPSPIVTPAAVTDSGGLRLTNLPRGSTVMVDSKPLLEAETRLPVGPHEVAISAPRYTFFSDTVEIAANQVLTFAPQLVPIGTAPGAQPAPTPAALDCSAPSPANRYGRACYDKPPLPAGPSRVPLTDDITGTPSPAVLLVKVSADGRTVSVQTNTPSNSRVFTDLAVAFAKELKWQPAAKNGTPVEGWTQFAFYPSER